MMESICIEESAVFDTGAKEFVPTPVLLKGDTIESLSSGAGPGKKSIIIDAQGLYTAPGFMDFHGHFFKGGTDIGVDPDLACLPFGVTFAGDAGSTGISNFESFNTLVMDQARVSMRAFLNLSPAGLITTKYHEDLSPEAMDGSGIAALYAKYRSRISGLKLRLSKEVVKERGMAALEKARAIADTLDCRLNIHATNPAVGIRELLSCLRAGDIFTHVFHGKGETIIQDKRVCPEILDARARGIIFDAANGANHFSFEVAETAVSQGFLPDIISTDITKNTLNKPPVFSLVHILSKYLNMGVSLEELIPLCTRNPAKAMDLYHKTGEILPGKKADITLFRIIDQAGEYTDFAGERLMGKKAIEIVMTIKNGVILFLNPGYANIVKRG